MFPALAIICAYACFAVTLGGDGLENLNGIAEALITGNLLLFHTGVNRLSHR